MQCIVLNCNNNSTQTSQGITYHKFPREPSARTTWLAALHMTGCKSEDLGTVCSNHFLKDDLMMSNDNLCVVGPGAVPVGDALACRICLATDCKLHRISAYRVLTKTYETLMGLSIENENNLPPYLCSECTRRLLNCARFRNTGIRSHLAMLDVIKSHGCMTLELIQSVKENLSFVSNQAYGDIHPDDEIISVLTEAESNYIEELTGMKPLLEYIAVDNIKVEDYDVTDQDQNPLDKANDSSCHVIPSEYVSVDNVKVESDDNKNAENPEETANNMSYMSSLRNYISLDIVKVENHAVDENETDDSNHADIECGFIGEDFTPDDGSVLPERQRTAKLRTIEQMTKIPEHVPRQKPKPDVVTSFEPYQTNSDPQLPRRPKTKNPTEFYSCNMCSYITLKKTILNRHFKSHLNEKPYSCHMCSKSFNRKDYLTKHLRIHSGRKPYQCDVCNKIYNDKVRLAMHLRTHSGERPHPCNVCNKTFMRKDQLKKHLRVHAGERPYQCDVCKKAFTYLNALREHVRIHTGERPYSCNVCDKAFTAQSALRGHLRIHSGVKPYSCNVCDKTFNQKANLTTHQRIHSGVKPYSCHVCNKSFNRKEQVRKHLIIHSGEKPYSCNVCNKAFNQKDNLTRHLKIHSGEKPYS